MPFTFKLARRLARVRGIVVLCTALAPACELPVVTAADAPLVRVLVSPDTVIVSPSAHRQFAAYGRTAAGDSIGLAVTWSGSGGTITPAGLYTAGPTPGTFRVIASDGRTGIADTSTVTVVSPPAPNPGTPTNLAVTGATTSSATLAFTEVNDGTGQAARYDVRYAAGTMIWGSAASVTSGTCATPLLGTSIGATRSCTVTGLAAATTYQFQLIAYRGTPNVNAVYGGVSNVASGTTASSTAPVASVTVSPATAAVDVGRTLQLTATPRDAAGNALSGRLVTWATSDPLRASVSAVGVVTGVAVGPITITATSEGKSGTASITVTTPPPPPPPGAWPNEPVGMTLVTDAPFNALSEGGWNAVQRQTTNGSGLSISSDPTAPASPANVLTYKYAAGYTAGSEPGAEYYAPGPGVKETFVGFWWKASNPWQFHPSGVNKVAFMFSSGPDNIYLMMYNDGTGPTIQVETQYSSDVRRLAPNVTATPVTLGVWHRIEWYVKYSTTGSSRDGVARWWVDGVLQGGYTDLQMPADGGIVEYTIAPTWGGIGGTKTETDFYWYDQYHVSRR